MSELNDLLGNEQPSLEELSPEEATRSPTINKATSDNLAAITTALDGGNMETYSNVQMEMELDGWSATADQVVLGAKEQSFNEARTATVDFLADPMFDDETKGEVAKRFLDRTSDAFGMRNILATRQLAEVQEDQTPETEKGFISLAPLVNEINQYKRDKQALLNKSAAMLSSDMTDVFVDLASIVVPGVEEVQVARLVADIKGENGEEASLAAKGKALLLMGSTKAEIKENLMKVPVKDRLRVAQTLADSIYNTNRITATGENDYLTQTFLRTMLEDGYYEDADVWIDNFISVLDITVLGGIVAKGVRTGRAFVKGLKPLEGDFIPRGPDDVPPSGERGVRAPIDDEFEVMARDARIEGTVTARQPASLADLTKETNPRQAKLFHEAAMKSEGDESAMALYGTNKADVAVSDLGMKPEMPSGIIEARVHNIDEHLKSGNIDVDADLMDLVGNRNGFIHYWEADKRSARANVVQNFEAVHGLRAMAEHSTIGISETSDGLKISQIYGPPEGFFGTAQEAIDQVSYALRDWGITEDNIIVLGRTARGYEAGVTDANAFVAKVDYKYTIDPLDVMSYQTASVKKNPFDRIPALAGEKRGSLMRNLVDAHSMLHPKLTLGANVAVDKAAGLERKLLELGKGFTDKYTALPKDRQAILDEIVKEANTRNTPLLSPKNIADGLSTDEIAALKDWKKYWDTQYWLENRDAARSLRHQGFQLLETGSKEDRLFARPIGSDRAPRKVYDPTTGNIRRLTSQEMDEVYESAGTIAKTRSPIQIDGDAVDHVLVRNNVETSYLRRINDSDQVMMYREGYYQIHYKAPKFIIERIKDAEGVVLTERAIAVAGNTRDATIAGKRFASTSGKKFEAEGLDPEASYYIRGDIHEMSLGNKEYWELNSSGGRTAQRVRGKRLEEGNSPTNVGSDNSFVMSPVDSMVYSAISIANRTSMRDFLETTKRRFLQQFSEVLKKDERGMPVWPIQQSDISLVGRQMSKHVADARTTWEWVNYLESGYVNGLDDAYKGILNLMSHTLKNVSPKAEEFLHGRAMGKGPSAAGKSLSYNVYIGLNPARQIIVQSHQATFLAVNFPKYVLTQNLSKDLSAFVTVNMGGSFEVASKLTSKSTKELETMYKHFQDSGLAAAIDKQSLVRGSMYDLADKTQFRAGINPVKKGIDKALMTSRKIGFDTGEYLNMASAWLAYYDRALVAAKGKPLTQRDLDMVSGLARNYTYNMNTAGDMPYNHNSLALIFQYQQVPHKAALQLTNRILSPGEKLRLFAYHSTMFTLPPALMLEMFGDILPNDPDHRDAVVQGLEGTMFNALLTAATGQDTFIDYSSLGALNMFGTYEFITSLMTLDAMEIIAATPAGSLVVGQNPRITKAAKSIARYVHGTLDSDFEDPIALTQAFKDFVSISSGFSNAFKMEMALEYGRKVSALNSVTDRDVMSVTAYAQALGLPSIDEAYRRVIKNKLFESQEEYGEDIKEYYKQMKIDAGREGVTPEDREYASLVHGLAARKLKELSPAYLRDVTELIKRDVKNGDGVIYKRSIEQLQFQSPDEMRKVFNLYPRDMEEQRQQGLKTIDLLEKLGRNETIEDE